MPFTPNKILKTAFGAGLFIILCIGGFSYKHIKSLSESSQTVKVNYSVSNKLEKIVSNLKDAESAQRGFLLTYDSLFLKPYNSSLEKINYNLIQLDTLIAANSQQRINLKKLDADIQKRVKILDRSLTLVSDKVILSQDLLYVIHEGKIAMDDIHNDIVVMQTLENKLLEKSQTEADKALDLTPLFFFGLLILTLVLLLAAYSKMNKDLVVLKDTNDDLETFKKLTQQAEKVSKSGTWIWYVEENEFHFSDNLYRLLGEEPDSFIANLENFFTYVHDDDIEGLGQQINKMIKEEDLPFVYYRVVLKDGSIKHLKAYAKLIENDFDEKQLLGVTIDITDVFDNVKLIEERNQELERNNKELSAFNYVASHDLQEPLRKIQTFISRLESKEKDNLSESGNFYIEKIKSSSARMRMLIEDLLQYSRTNRSDHEFTKTNMNLLLEHAKDELIDTIEAKEAVITNDNLPTMEVISFQIQQLFINLINNSLKYSKDGVPPQIKIKHKEVLSNEVDVLKKSFFKYYHKITFEDNGIGFDQAYAEKIFTLFNRLHGKAEYSGTGIGLAICKKIVENHNGMILAEGTPNRGAKFIVYLPFLK